MSSAGSSSPAGTAPPPSASREELRVAVVGVGVMGADHVRRLRETTSGARVVVVTDALAARAAEVAAGVPGCRAVDDPFDAVRADDVDAVVVASPGHTHGDLVLACLDAGKPVLCEKPLTTDAASALAVVRAEDEVVERTGRRLVQLGFMRRFDPEYVALKDLLDSGDLGAPLLVHCAHRNPSVPPHFDNAMMINDSVVHEVDVARFLLDEEVTAVTVLRPTASRHAVEGRSDPMMVLLETEGGRLVDVEIFARTGVAYEVRTEVVAEEGSASIGHDLGLVRHLALDGAGVRTTRVAPGFRERFARAYDLEVQRWADAARRGEADGPGVWDGYAAAAVCEAGVQALRTGQRTPVSLAPRRRARVPAPSLHRPPCPDDRCP